MLIGVETIHQPNTVDEAAELVNATVRPLYGGVALHRESPHDVVAVVNLHQLGLDQSRLESQRLLLGSMLTLEGVRQICNNPEIPNGAFLAEVIRQEAPINLRNTMTLGDALIERRANSVLLTALVALEATVNTTKGNLSIQEWLDVPKADIRTALILEVSLLRGSPQARHAFQKVARTPADAPIVGAIAVVENEVVRLALCGVANHPISVTSDLSAAIELVDNLELNPPGDHWGSSEYRAAMGRLMARRVLERML
jgi:CO/xanthine dehydrogenase FAD-binding subunit